MGSLKEWSLSKTDVGSPVHPESPSMKPEMGRFTATSVVKATKAAENQDRGKMGSQWKAWIRVVRPKFFLAGIPSVILGTAISWHLARIFDLSYFLLTLLGIIFAMAGCYTLNEYFDFKSCVDLIVKEEDITPFSAGSRVLPEGLISPPLVLKAGIIFWLLASMIGAYLTLVRGWLIVIFALAGMLAGVFYTSPPFKWAYRGIGEALIGLTYGPLITLGSCYVQHTNPSLLTPAILPSLIPGFLITAVIWINELPDYFADKEAGKKNLVVRVGREKASNIYILLLIVPYLLLSLGVLVGQLPPSTLIALLTIPIAYRNIATVRKKYNKPKELIPAMKGTILLFTLTSLLLSLGYITGVHD